MVLDQGLAQAVYSLALFRKAALPALAESLEALSALFDVLPRPDVLIKLEVSAEVLRTRLDDRWQRNGRRRWPHSRLELLSRADNRAVEDSMRLLDCIQTAIECQGWKMIRRRMTEGVSITQVAERLAQEVLAREPTPAQASRDPMLMAERRPGAG
jgi:hypothetical protein